MSRTRTRTALLAALTLAACTSDSTEPGALHLSFDVPAVALQQGDSVAVVVAIAASGISGSIEISVPELPVGVTATVPLVPEGATTAIITLHAAVSAPLVTGVMTITSTSRRYAGNSVSIPVTVTSRGAFALSMSGDTLYAPRAGLTVSTNVRVIRSDGFVGGVQIDVTAPAGITTAINAAAAADEPGTPLDVVIGAGVAPGNYTIMVRATSPGRPDQSRPLTIRVDPSAPFIFINNGEPLAATVLRTGRSVVSVNVDRSGGYAGPATLGVVTPVPGISVGFTPGATPDRLDVTVAATAAASVGTYVLEIDSNNGSVRSMRTRMVVTIATGNVRPITPLQQVVQVNGFATGPRIQVIDALGRGLPGVPVEFRPGGGGTIADSTVFTDAGGFVTAQAWQVDTVARTYTMSVTAGGTTATTTFQATALAGPPARISKHAGDQQSFRVSHALNIRPEVRVVDRFGNPNANALVSFAATPGSGSVSPAVDATDLNGIAQTTWTVGSAQNDQTMTAATAGLPPVTFTALLYTCDPRPMIMGDTLHNNLSYLDACPQASTSQFGDAYTFTLATAGTFSILPSTFGYYDSWLSVWIMTAAGEVIIPAGMVTSFAPHVVALPAGAYKLVLTVAEFGYAEYAVTTMMRPADACEEVVITTRYPVSGAIDSQDCLQALNRFDSYRVHLNAGQTVTVSAVMSATGALEITTPELTTQLSGATNTPSITFTAASSGSHRIRIYNPFPATAANTYTLKIQ